jgi:hypothetical protein
MMNHKRTQFDVYGYASLHDLIIFLTKYQCLLSEVKL